VVAPGIPDDLADAIAVATARAVLPLVIEWAPSLPSTMDVAAAAARSGVAEGYAIVAGTQTSGRGRRGRVWESPPGAGLYLSLLLRPPAGEARLLALLTLAIGVGVRRAIGYATGLAPDLKWPNDLVIGSRKLAGILAEGHAVATGAQAVVVGIGVNVRRAVMSRDVSARATSLEEELGRTVPPASCLEALLVEVASVYDDLRRGRADDILGEWLQASPSATGASVEWEGPGGTRRGVTAGVDRDGALIVMTPASNERLIGGVVRWR
jgi:BirA family biotin operon repressor/biotin-[acetyl-CoA-carboxylase] ligase